ncbi:MAG: calcium-binding protein, partial [Pseudomonas sp.]
AFSAVHVEGGGGEDFSLGFFSYSQTIPGQPIDLAHAITATDGDGDAITSTINSTLYPLSSSVEGNSSDNLMTGTGGVDQLFGYGGNDTLSGLLGNDVLSGGDGNDTLIGGLGNDLLSGGAGKDTLVWNSGDTGVDHVTDFFIDGPGVAGGNSDALDLTQLLVGESASGNVLDDYLSFTFAATSTTIDVRATSSGAVVQQVVLEGVDLSSGAYYGSTDAATVIDGMLGDNALKVDTV